MPDAGAPEAPADWLGELELGCEDGVLGLEGLEELELGLGGIGIDELLELWVDWHAATVAPNAVTSTSRTILSFSFSIISAPNLCQQVNADV